MTDQHVEDVTCNLVQQSASLPDTVVFESDGTTLPAGHAIALELGSLPVPWTTYARWGAVAGLAILLLGTSAIMRHLARAWLCAKAGNQVFARRHKSFRFPDLAAVAIKRPACAFASSRRCQTMMAKQSPRL